MRLRHPLLSAWTVLSLALALGCAGAEPSPGGPLNLLVNPGFEDGSEGWSSLGGRAWGAFEVVEGPARSGKRSARLRLDWPSGRGGAPVKVFGVVQEPSPARFPELLSGWYRVGDWWSESAETKLYVQAVIIVWDDPAVERLVPSPEGSPPIRNYQLRYYLAGLSEPPFRLSNARAVMVTRAAPPRDRWVRFELPIRHDFEELWGHVPEGFSSLRVLFEARWDGKPEGAGVRAEVWYDDLLLGAPLR